MRPGFWHRLDMAARQVVPVSITLILLFIGMTPLHAPGFFQVMPGFALMAIFYWGMYRPELMPQSIIFLLGVLQDVFLGTPLGLHSLIYLGVHGAVTFQRGFFYDKSFFVIWLVFAMVSGGAMVLGLVLLSFVNMSFVAPGAAFFQYLLTLGFFPVISWLLSRLHRLVLEDL